MKILFDHQIFCYKYGGASKYFAELINAMPVGSWEVTSLLAMNEYVRENHSFASYRKLFKGQSVVADYLNRPYSCYRIRKGDYDVFHQTNFGIYCLESLRGKPMVTTYHDSNLSTFDFHPDIVDRQRVSLRRADAVICVSENTKKDMLQLFDIDERKVHVIYHGVKVPDLESLDKSRLFAFPYVLYVGRRSRYKNFERFVKAFAMVHGSYPDVRLVCTSRSFSREELEMLGNSGIGDAACSINASEQEMQRLYRDALLFAFPSIYEGFGMPILEAWSFGCPVVLSDASCFPEIAGDAGLYFNATDVEEMAHRMIQVISDDNVRHQLVAKGMERVKSFSWEACSDAHLRVYRSLV